MLSTNYNEGFLRFFFELYLPFHVAALSRVTCARAGASRLGGLQLAQLARGSRVKTR